MEIIGQTIDDAAGETFDKASKIMGLPYPGGPIIEIYAKQGNPDIFKFPEPQIKGLNFSFSGLKTSILYFLRDNLKKNPNFIEENKYDLCASIQKTIINILINKLILASSQTGIKNIAIAGGVSANLFFRKELLFLQKDLKWKVFIPKLEYCTDNAAMIAITGYHKFINNNFGHQNVSPYTKQIF
jgi:N6-L-threonylcarbamoyladenine synthase